MSATEQAFLALEVVSAPEQAFLALEVVSAPEQAFLALEVVFTYMAYGENLKRVWTPIESKYNLLNVLDIKNSQPPSRLTIHLNKF